MAETMTITKGPTGAPQLLAKMPDLDIRIRGINEERCELVLSSPTRVDSATRIVPNGDVAAILLALDFIVPREQYLGPVVSDR